MHIQFLERPAGDEQEPLTTGEIQAMCARLLGDEVVVHSAVEMGWGSYNTCFRLALADGRTVVMRVAPRTVLQRRSERHWLRTEYLAAPHLIDLGELVPRLLGADFSHGVIGRDYLVQSFLPGVPAPQSLPAYARDLWPGYFQQLGEITRRVHEIKGDGWGPLGTVQDDRWSDALLRSTTDSIVDLAEASLATEQAERFADLISRRRDRLDSILGPRLLHGDLWTANILLDPTAAHPRIVGVVDSERAWWGDPLADWSLYRAGARSIAAERDAFWSGYGGEPAGGDAQWRLTLYRGRHLMAERIEAARTGNVERVTATEEELASVLTALGG